MDETLLTAAVCLTREGYELGQRIGISSEDFSEAGRVVVSSSVAQYERDAEQSALSLPVLRSQVERRFGPGSMADSVMDFVERFPDDTSTVNVLEEYRLLRLSRVGTQIATALATGQQGEETDKLLDEYRQLSVGLENEKQKFRLDVSDFEEEDGDRMPLFPKSLNEFIGGGLLPGHNVTVYGRPDSGKSMFALNQAAEACKAGFTVLYVANEEPARDLTRRLLAKIAAVDIDELRDPRLIEELLEEYEEPYYNWNLLHKAGATIRDVKLAARRTNPDLIVVDQIKNLDSTDKGDNRALQLDKIARQVRETGIEYEAVTMSVTQAGESAHGVLGLTMTDIEWSNTGIPGAADLMIGIGVNDEYDADSMRMLSIPKNKVNGRHGMFPCWVVPERTAFLSKARRG